MEHRCGLVLPLDRLEALVGDWRRGKLPALAAQVPAHVTLAHPLPALSELGDAVEALRALFAREPAFDLTLDGFGRFPAARVLYLEPHPADLLYRLADAAYAAIPGAAPEITPYIFHATLTQSAPDLDMAEVEMRAYWGRDLPLTERIDRAELYERTSGPWRLHEAFPLGG